MSGWVRKPISQTTLPSMGASGSWLRRPQGYNVMEPKPIVPDTTQYRPPTTTRKYSPLDPFGGMTGEEMSRMYREHQNALLNIGAGPTELPVVNDQTAPLPFVSLAWWGKVGEDLDKAGSDALGLFYKKVESTARAWGDWTAPKPIKEPEKVKGLSTDSFTDPEFEPVHGLSSKEAPYAYKGLQSAVGLISGIPHLLGGIGTIRDAWADKGFKEGAVPVASEMGAGLVSLINPFDPSIDGPERFHRSLNVMLFAAGGMKGFKSLRERGAVKMLTKEGLSKQDARFVVKEVQAGLRQIDSELGQKFSFETALDDLTQSRAREILRTIDPSLILEPRKEYVAPVAPVKDWQPVQMEAVEVPDVAPSLAPEVVSPPINILGDPIDVPPAIGKLSETGRITVNPITDGPLVPDDQIWSDFFNEVSWKSPRESRSQKGKVGKGKFDKDQATIVVRSMRNSSTVAHEAGHMFNEVYKLSEGVPTDELRALVGDLDVAGRNLPDEAVAEFIRGMMVNPEETMKRAPTMMGKYVSDVPQPVFKAVAKAGERLRRIVGQEPQELVTSQVRLDLPPSEKGLWKSTKTVIESVFGRKRADTTKPYKLPTKRLAQMWVGNDNHAGLLEAQNYIKEVATLKELMPEEDAFLLAARHRYVNNQVTETVAGGIRDEFGQVVYYDNTLGLLQQNGKAKVSFNGSEVEVPLLRQIESKSREVNGSIARMPDGTLTDPAGQPLRDTKGLVIEQAGTAEPMTLKWVLEPLGGSKAPIGDVFERFIARGVSERALEIHARNQREQLAPLLDKLLDDAPDEVNPIIEDAVVVGNKQAGAKPIDTEAIMDAIHGGTNDQAMQVAISHLIDSLESNKWQSREAQRAVRFYKQQTRNLTGAGRGLIDDVSIAEAVTLFEDSMMGSKDRLAVGLALTRYRAYSNALLRYLVKSGMLDEPGFAKIVENNKKYFDLGRVMDELSENADVPKYHREDIKALTSKARGAAGQIESPIVNLMANTEQVVRLAERNRMLNAFLEPIRNTTDPTARNLLNSIAEQVEARGKDTVPVFNQGKIEHWRFEPGTNEAFKPDHMLKGIPEALMKVIEAPRNLLMWGVTNMPSFVTRNAIRDYFDARIKGQGISLKDYGDAFRATDAEAGWYDYYGGGIAIWDDLSLRKGWHKFQNEVLKQVSAADNTNPFQVLLNESPRVVFEKKGVFAKYGEFRSRVERAARLAEGEKAFETAKADIRKARPHWSEERIEYNAYLRAGQASRDIIDFARGAKVWKAVNRGVAFTNARIQGLDTSFAAVKKAFKDGDKVKIRNFTVKLAAQIGTIGLAEYAINRMAGSEEDWRNQPAYLKDMFWLFPGPANTWIRIPKPFEFGALASVLPRIAYNDWSGFLSDDGNVFHGTAANMLSPVAYDDMLQGPLGVVNDLRTNHDSFRQAPIVPDHEANLALPLRKGTKNASTVSQIVSMGLVDPRYLDFTVRGFTGNFGQSLTTVLDEPDAESLPRYINVLTGLTTTDGSSNNHEVRRAMKHAASVGVTGVFSEEFDVLAEARNGDILTGGRKVWEAKKSIVEKAKQINQLIEEQTRGKSSLEQLEIIKEIVNDFK